MPEYIRITPEYDPDDELVAALVTNLNLAYAGEEEYYGNPTEGEEGSPLAQLMFLVDGIEALTITENTLIIRRNPDVDWYVLIDEISTAIKDFYL